MTVVAFITLQTSKDHKACFVQPPVNGHPFCEIIYWLIMVFENPFLRTADFINW